MRVGENEWRCVGGWLGVVGSRDERPVVCGAAGD